ncbi:MAG: type II secretion system F family protein [Candidatus Bathyarchaeota archaeon]|nr:type II secretion system F family protein [Candidatus Bathyarchaeota archaeon]
MQKNQNVSGLRDFCYAYFGWAGRVLTRFFSTVEDDLEASYLKIHSEVYFSIVSFIAILSTALPISLLIVYIAGLLRGTHLLPFENVMVLPVTFIIPLLIILVSLILPKTFSSSRMSNLQIEIPYASMYISVMVSGGLSPFQSFLRMKHMDLLPNMQDEVSRIQTMVMSTGIDPVTAMEQAAKTVELKEYNELLLGYASSVRTGGDTQNYLFNQTRSMFRMLAIKVKAKGESAALLMEAYTIIAILGVLGIFLVFVVGMSLPTAGASISPDQFFLFSFIIMPFLSFIFIYAGDATQFNYPISNWKPYYVFAGFLPVGLLLATQFVLPFFVDSFMVIPALTNFVIWLTKIMSLSEGSEAAVGLVLTLILIAIPGWIADHITAGRDGRLMDGITQFLRDLVEVRKSGLSPERAIEALSAREYRGFSRYLNVISTKIAWGYPLRQIYDEFAAKIKNWLALVNIYLLIDTIEVGGGTEQSIESLAEFSESTKQLEAEKRAVLMPLIIVPYIGAALLTGTTVMFLSFFTSSDLGISIPYKMLLKTLLTPLALHSFTLGLVTGKIVSGRVSAGFKHAILLCLVSLGGIWAVSNMSMGGGLI